MPVGVRAVANELLDLAEDSGSGIDPLQMEKLVYLSQGWALGLLGTHLFREWIEAWEYGPVVPELYHNLKMFGSSRIKGRMSAYDYAQRRIVTASETFGETEGEIIRAVWEKYGSWSGPRLIRLTHQPGSPWQQTRGTHPFIYNPRIDPELIKEWFEAEAVRASLLNVP
jgi:uncharacterized phage-associated protein